MLFARISFCLAPRASSAHVRTTHHHHKKRHCAKGDDVESWVTRQLATRDMLVLPPVDLFMYRQQQQQQQHNNDSNGHIGVKYKERYNAHGHADMYGAYDRNGVYRVTDLYYNTPPDDTHGNDSHSSGEEKEREQEEEEYDEDESSSGEYPPDYFERVFAGEGAGIDDYMTNTGGRSNNSNNGCNDRRSGFPGEGYRQLQKFQQAFSDIGAVLERPSLPGRSEGDDAVMQVAMIRAIMARFGGVVNACSTAAPTIAETPVKRVQNREPPPEELQPTKKKLKLTLESTNGAGGSARRPAYTEVSAETIDRNYMARVGQTDCFNCLLCDPFKLKEIKLPAWGNHCISQIHCAKRDNETQQKHLYGS